MQRTGTISVILTLALLLALTPAQVARADTYTVTTTTDAGAGSLRWAIEQANGHPGPDTVQFDIAGCGGLCTIRPESPLPILTDDMTTIDGYTQEGAASATAGAAAVIQIKIDGSLAGAGVIGLSITSNYNLIRGLALTGFDGDGIAIVTADGNTISGNYVGLDPAGHEAGNNGRGIAISGGTQATLVGGNSPAERNNISGNAADGVGISGSGTIKNVVSGNYIGTAPDGTSPLANGLAGVRISGSAQHNTVGPDNVISGNTWEGVRIAGSDTMSNTVKGNYIGTNAAGTAAVQNLFGVYVSTFAQRNNIGPDNVISGNERYGVDLHSIGVMSNTVTGNTIGADDTGQVALPNGWSGVYLSASAQRNTIGPDNIISGNGDHGVYVRGSAANNTIYQNTIGAAADGTAALGNARAGVAIEDGAEGTWVEENVISANEYGVLIQSAVDVEEATSAHTIVANAVGVGKDGASPLGNSEAGVHIGFRSQHNNVAANIIAHNGGDGVAVDTPLAFGNLIWFNSIHNNGELGIDLTNGANGGIGAPIIHMVELEAGIVSGAACPECAVQVFASPDDDGEGVLVVGTGEAGPAGDFDVSVDLPAYPYLTATATDFDDDGTSEFSEVFTVDMPLLSSSTKTVTATHPLPGQPLTYTIALSNTGTGPASATLTDTLPADVTWADDYTSSSGTVTWDAAERRLLWSGTVSVGTPETIVYRVRLNDGMGAGTTITNTATLNDGMGHVHKLGPATVTVDVARAYLPLVGRGF